MKQLILILIRLYQHTLSPDHGWISVFFPYGFCRWHPSCSEYAYQCIKRHNLGRGIWLTLRRLRRCQPFSQGGNDFAPS